MSRKLLTLWIVMAPLAATAFVNPVCLLVGTCGMLCCEHEQNAAVVLVTVPQCEVPDCEISAPAERHDQLEAVLPGTTAPQLALGTPVAEATPVVRPVFRPEHPSPSLARNERVSLYVLNSAFLI